MPDDLDASLGADEYDDLVDALAERAATAPADRSPADGAWDAATEVVPSLTEPVCERILAHADSDPDAVLVAQVTEERGSDDAERRRAEALTALVGDVVARLESVEDDAETT